MKNSALDIEEGISADGDVHFDIQDAVNGTEPLDSIRHGGLLGDNITISSVPMSSELIIASVLRRRFIGDLTVRNDERGNIEVSGGWEVFNRGQQFADGLSRSRRVKMSLPFAIVELMKMMPLLRNFASSGGGTVTTCSRILLRTGGSAV
jgi:hypothetical protein